MHFVSYLTAAAGCDSRGSGNTGATRESKTVIECHKCPSSRCVEKAVAQLVRVQVGDADRRGGRPERLAGDADPQRLAAAEAAEHRPGST
jgi:hypothetical protein